MDPLRSNDAHARCTFVHVHITVDPPLTASTHIECTTERGHRFDPHWNPAAHLQMGYNGPKVPEPSSGNAALWEYGYVPSLAMGIFGVVTFLLVSGPHLLYLFKKRGTRSGGVTQSLRADLATTPAPVSNADPSHGLFFFAAVTEGLGYGARLYSHNHPFNVSTRAYITAPGITLTPRAWPSSLVSTSSKSPPSSSPPRCTNQFSVCSSTRPRATGSRPCARGRS